jgi:hypothetical protein
MVQSAYRPGDIVIYDCSFISPRGSYVMIDNILEVVIYESIMVQNNIAEIKILDTQAVIDKLTVTGDEILSVSFGVPGLPTLTYTFALESVEIHTSEVSEKAREITFHGVGREALVAKSCYIQKSYNTDIASIVKDIHTTFLQSVNKLATEVTNGIQKLIIPNLKPFDAIDMVRRRAASSENPSSTFLYFQNADGHNFKTIEGMMQTGVVKSFIHSDAIGTSIFNESLNQIIDYDIPQLFSATQRIDLGGLVQRTSTFDIRTRQYNKVDQKIADGKFGNGGSWNSPFFKAVYGAAFNLFSFVPTDSASRPETNIATSTPLQLAYLSNLLQGYITLKVYGDTRVKAGDMVHVDIPQSTATSDRGTDQVLSGNYLISRIARRIGPANVRPRYLETLEGLNGVPNVSP